MLQLQDQTRGTDEFDKVAQMKKAAKLAWIFPGAGHFASGKTGKGLLFSGLELAALAGLAVFSGSYSTNADGYNLELSEYNDWSNEVQNTGAWSSADLVTKRQAVNDAFDLQQQDLYGLIGCGAVSGVIWIWNIMDMKKSKSVDYSDKNRFSMGINRHGQVEARISF